MGKLPLEGVRAVDAGEVLAGAHPTTLLADMGAEVIKVEAIQRYQSIRGGIGTATQMYPNQEPGEHPWNRAAGHNHLNRNKLGITLDLTNPKGVKIFKDLIAVSDIFTENFRTGVMERFGLDYPDLVKINPSIIMVSLPGFGRTGPYATYASMGTSNDGVSGHTALRGYIGDDPSKGMGVVHPDGVAALNGAVAALMAYYSRLRTGKGQHIDLSQTEATMTHLAEAILDYTMNQRVQKPMGNRHPTCAPHGCYPCQGVDQWVVIAIGTEEEWASLVELMGSPEWAGDPRFADPLSRWKNQDELDRRIGQWTCQFEKNQAMELMQRAGISAGSTMTMKDIYSDPHINVRGFLEMVTHKEAGTHLSPGISWKMSRTPCSIRMAGPCLGEHNEYVLGEILGLGSAEIRELEAEQVIGYAPLPGSNLSSEDRRAMAEST